jgi:hydroxymethylpyrimidine kinase / phosphomethylpyrimidine kinase / thiamine-phosphate diphosphorylase
MTVPDRTCLLLARGPGAPIEQLTLDEARARAGASAGVATPALAASLRDAGARAVLLIQRETAWLDAPHARGEVRGVSVATQDVASRWSRFLAHGFVAADAALLALRRDDSPLPTLGWGDAVPGPLGARAPVDGIYAIVGSLDLLRGVLDAGITMAQLRIKRPADADAAWDAQLRQSLRDGLAAARDAGATLWINDHWRLAAELGAGAVHLGQEDFGALGDRGLREFATTGLALGVSSHAVWELCRARSLAPAYVACGPVWPTTTKDMPWRPQGLDSIGWWTREAGCPVVAIGGILDPQQVRETARAGASAVCVLRGLGDDPRRTVPALQDAFAQGRAQHDPRAAPHLPHPSLEADA